MEAYHLDALVTPTMGPAGLTDLVVGDRYLGISSNAAFSTVAKRAST